MANDRLTRAVGSGKVISGRRLDQPGQCYAHRVVEIGVGEAHAFLRRRCLVTNAFSIRPETSVFPFLGRGGLWFVLCGPNGTDGSIGAGSQIDKDVIDDTHHVFVGAECRHY